MLMHIGARLACILSKKYSYVHAFMDLHSWKMYILCATEC